MRQHQHGARHTRFKDASESLDPMISAYYRKDPPGFGHSVHRQDCATSLTRRPETAAIALCIVA